MKERERKKSLLCFQQGKKKKQQQKKADKSKPCALGLVQGVRIPESAMEVGKAP